VALPPTIPTSFVPKQPVATQPRRSRARNGIFYYGGLFILGAAIVGALLTFGYKTYLDTVRTARKATLEAAEKHINRTEVEDFLRLRNRIRVADTLINQHVVSSQFFDVLEGITLQNVRFQSLILSIGEDRTAKIEMHGMARSFNALAAESAAFAAEKKIKRAIFSSITADKNGVVSFTLRAELDPKLTTTTVETASTRVAPPNVATTTAPFAPTASTTITLPAAPKPGVATTTP
jgi:Tfp pilus assembly protein PilN